MATLRRIAAWLRSYGGVALGVFAVWALVVATGAQSRPSATRWIGIPSLGDVVLALLAAWCLGAIVFLVWVARAPTGDDELPPPPPGRSNLRLMVVFAIFFVIVLSLLPRHDEPLTLETEERESVPAALPAPEAEAAPTEPTAAAISGPQLAGLGALVIVSAAFLMWNRRRMATDPGPSVDATPDAPIGSLAARAAENIRLGDDARSAVLLAYAELENGLAAAGWPRHPAETPSEHTRRVVAPHAVDGSALVELAELYERARFSDLAITTDDRQAATRALDRLLGDLAVPA